MVLNDAAGGQTMKSKLTFFDLKIKVKKITNNEIILKRVKSKRISKDSLLLAFIRLCLVR